MEQGATSNWAKDRNAPSRKNLSWSKDEETALVDGLKEHISWGYKCDNGFKSGSTLLLEGMIRKVVPLTKITAKPHIESKLKTWKKLYNSLKLMLGPNGSGVGVLNGEYRIEATEEKWDAQIKRDPDAHALKNKSFPLYDQWKEVFGNDYAVGDNAQNCPDVVDEVQSQPHTQSPFEFESTPSTPPSTHSFMPDNQPRNRGEGSRSTNTSGRKWKSQQENSYIDQLGQFFDRTDLSISNMATQLVDQLKDDSNKRQRLFDVLKGYDFMSPDDILNVAEYMANHPNDLDIWWSFPDSFKMAKVKKILEQQNF